MNAFIVMSYETIRIKSPFMQFFIPLYSGGGLWDAGFFFFFFRVFKNHVPNLLHGNTKHHFLSTFVQKLVRYIMINSFPDPIFWLYVASVSIKCVW